MFYSKTVLCTWFICSCIFLRLNEHFLFFLVGATKNIQVDVCADESCKLCGITEEVDKNRWFTVYCEGGPMQGNLIQLTNPTINYLVFCEMKIYGHGLLFSIFYSSPQFTSKVCPKTENTFSRQFSDFTLFDGQNKKTEPKNKGQLVMSKCKKDL